MDGLLVDVFSKSVLYVLKELTEDHLRAQIPAIDPSVDHGNGGNEEQEEHEGVKENSELADPQLLPSEVKPLARDIEAHYVEKRQDDENNEARKMYFFSDAMPEGGMSRRRLGLNPPRRLIYNGADHGVVSATPLLAKS